MCSVLPCPALPCPAATGQVEVPIAGPEQQRRDGLYLQQKLGPHVAHWLQKQTAEVSQALC
jgi:hypothetical protein